MVVEGEEVRAFIEVPSEPADHSDGSEKRDGTPVLTGTASIGPDYGDTEIDHGWRGLDHRTAVILSELSVGQQGAGNPEDAIMMRSEYGRTLSIFLKGKARTYNRNS